MGMQPGVLQIPTAQALFASVQLILDFSKIENRCLHSDSAFAKPQPPMEWSLNSGLDRRQSRRTKSSNYYYTFIIITFKQSINTQTHVTAIRRKTQS